MERLSNVNKIPLGPYTRLTYSWDLVLCLADFIRCIGVNKKDLKSPRNKQLMLFRQIFYNDKEFNPGRVLSDYIYLEANSFFKYAETKGRRRQKYSKFTRLP